MPNPLADSFAAACKVRPEIADIVFLHPPHEWSMEGLPITEPAAESAKGGHHAD